MNPIPFQGQNKTLTKPENMTDEECSDLPVLVLDNTCISCWQLSDAEIEKLAQTRVIWLGVLSGSTQPPVFVSVDRPFDIVQTNDKHPFGSDDNSAVPRS